LCCTAPCAASAWRSTFRSVRFSASLGAVRVAQPAPRRRRRNVIKARRPWVLLRRRPGDCRIAPPVHRDEREIIARN
jgi:hypothetical protein